MAGKKNGKRSLEEILEEHLEVTKEGFDELRTEMQLGFEELRIETQQGFKRVEGRLDNMLRTVGRSRRDHEARISALEADLAKIKKAG